MEPEIHEAIAAAMRLLPEYKRLGRLEFEVELAWQLVAAKIENGRIGWKTFAVGKKLMILLAKKQRWRCRYCEVDMREGRSNPSSPFRPTFDHWVALSRGGYDHPKNLVIACHSCNSRKGNTSPELFI